VLGPGWSHVAWPTRVGHYTRNCREALLNGTSSGSDSKIMEKSWASLWRMSIPAKKKPNTSFGDRKSNRYLREMFVVTGTWQKLRNALFVVSRIPGSTCYSSALWQSVSRLLLMRKLLNIFSVYRNLMQEVGFSH
jgi:hypothetical protein